MASVSVRLRSEEAERTLRLLRQRAPRAITRALNRAGGSARTFMAREVSRDMRLKVGTVRDRLRVREAKAESLTYRLEASLKRLPLIEFQPVRGPEPSRGRGRGVTARTTTGRYPHAFLATMRSGHRGVFERVGRARLAIRELKGPSIGHVFTKHAPAGLARGEEQLIKNLRHELRFATTGD